MSVILILAIVSVCSNTTFKNFNISDSLSVFVYVGGDV